MQKRDVQCEWEGHCCRSVEFAAETLGVLLQLGWNELDGHCAG